MEHFHNALSKDYVFSGGKQIFQLLRTFSHIFSSMPVLRFERHACGYLWSRSVSLIQVNKKYKLEPPPKIKINTVYDRLSLNETKLSKVKNAVIIIVIGLLGRGIIILQENTVTKKKNFFSLACQCCLFNGSVSYFIIITYRMFPCWTRTERETVHQKQNTKEKPFPFTISSR